MSLVFIYFLIADIKAIWMPLGIKINLPTVLAVLFACTALFAAREMPLKVIYTFSCLMPKSGKRYITPSDLDPKERFYRVPKVSAMGWSAAIREWNKIPFARCLSLNRALEDAIFVSSGIKDIRGKIDNGDPYEIFVALFPGWIVYLTLDIMLFDSWSGVCTAKTR